MRNRAWPDRTTRAWMASGGESVDLVVDYPLPILAVCLIVLLPLAVVGARTKSNHNQLSDLDPDRPSKIGAAAVKRYFAVGELSPALVLIHNPALDFRSPEGRQAVERGHTPIAIDRECRRGSLAHSAPGQSTAAPAETKDTSTAWLARL